MDLIESGIQVLGTYLFIEDCEWISRFVKVDNATLKRERLQYARVLVEVVVS